MIHTEIINSLRYAFSSHSSNKTIYIQYITWNPKNLTHVKYHLLIYFKYDAKTFNQNVKSDPPTQPSLKEAFCLNSTYPAKSFIKILTARSEYFPKQQWLARKNGLAFAPRWCVSPGWVCQIQGFDSPSDTKSLRFAKINNIASSIFYNTLLCFF